MLKVTLRQLITIGSYQDITRLHLLVESQCHIVSQGAIHVEDTSLVEHHTLGENIFIGSRASIIDNSGDTDITVHMMRDFTTVKIQLTSYIDSTVPIFSLDRVVAKNHSTIHHEYGLFINIDATAQKTKIVADEATIVHVGCSLLQDQRVQVIPMPKGVGHPDTVVQMTNSTLLVNKGTSFLCRSSQFLTPITIQGNILQREASGLYHKHLQPFRFRKIGRDLPAGYLHMLILDRNRL